MIAPMTRNTERGVGTMDTQTTAMWRRGKRGSTVTTTAAATRIDRDIDGTLIMKMDGEVQETVTHNSDLFSPVSECLAL